jgi:hypothetical protein
VNIDEKSGFHVSYLVWRGDSQSACQQLLEAKPSFKNAPLNGAFFLS